jgi:hypothetical protein
MARLEKSRGANFYAKYLAKGEAHIAQAKADRSDKAFDSIAFTR